MQKKLIVLLLLPLLIFGLCTQVCAVQGADPDKQCSITFLLEFDNMPLDGGKLTLYRVGQISIDGDTFVPLDSLQSDCENFNDLEDPSLAKTLNELAVTHGLKPFTASISNGKAIFSNLETGIYVVCQRLGEETKGYAAINPFLISLPQWQNDTYVYDITAAPKVPLVPSSTEPTESTKPTQPDDTQDLPQTGQLNWPVPLMAVLGLAIFSIGWGLFFGSKRRGI
ncbi:MAG: hypothetical protein IJD68_05290 [Ruminococcus sp.]|nr:hypothetical protein [Ruminococcus sp.]